MEIKVGHYYVNEHVKENTSEKNIIHVINPKSNTPAGIYSTETMWIQDDAVRDFYQNEWTDQFLKREATPEEVEKFKQARVLLPEKLKGYGESVTGFKVDSLTKIYNFLSEKSYSFSATQVIKAYLDVKENQSEASDKMSDCIENLEAEIKDLLKN